MSGEQNWVGLELGNKGGEGRTLSNMPVEYRAVIERKGDNDEYDLDMTYRFFVITQKLLNIKNGFVSSIG